MAGLQHSTVTERANVSPPNQGSAITVRDLRARIREIRMTLNNATDQESYRAALDQLKSLQTFKLRKSRLV